MQARSQAEIQSRPICLFLWTTSVPSKILPQIWSFEFFSNLADNLADRLQSRQTDRSKTLPLLFGEGSQKTDRFNVQL